MVSDILQRIRQLCAAHPAVLMTYSIATSVRSAMLLAGFFVGHGPRSGLKRETTQAATRLELLSQPLGIRWFERWMRSSVRFPGDQPADPEGWEAQIKHHSQFQLLEVT